MVGAFVTRAPVLLKPRVSAPRRRVRRDVRAAAVVPELQALLTQFVCPDFRECAGLVVGPEARQDAVVGLFWDLTHAYTIQHGEGFVLKALLAGDFETAREIAAGFTEYNAGLRLIHAALAQLHAVDIGMDA